MVMYVVMLWLILALSTEKSKLSSAGNMTRKSVDDPTSFSSRRQPDSFGRYERRLCAKLLEELMNADDGEAFFSPVDVKEVCSVSYVYQMPFCWGGVLFLNVKSC